MSCSRPNMAKDVIKKKQRIAHNKANGGHETFPECEDFVSSIISDMESNNDLMAIMRSGNFQTNTPETSKNTFLERTQNNVNQIPSRSHVSQKLGLSRKGPLMAKSQRTLKQLQHNRKLPKPRAHLAGLSNAKDLNNAKSISKFQNKAATGKQMHNRIAVDRNKTKRNSIEESKSKEIISMKLKPSVMEKKCLIKESSRILENVSKKNETAIVQKKSSHSINNSDNHASLLHSSDSDEYERFIRKEKRDLPQKSETKSKNMSQKSSKKVSRKQVSKYVSTESDSDLTDEESSNSHKSKKIRKTRSMLDNRQSTSSIKDKVPKKMSRNLRSNSNYVSPNNDSEMSDDGPSTSYKKRKKAHKIQSKLSDTYKEDSESQMDINDETYHNCSSESDDLPPPSEIMSGLPSTNNQCSNYIDKQHRSESSLHLHSNKDYNIPSVVSREEPKVLCNKSSNIASMVSSKQPNILHNEISSNEILNIASMVSRKQPNILQNEISNIASMVNSKQPNVLQNETSSNEIHNIASKVGSNQHSLQNQISSNEIPNIASRVSNDQPNILHKSSDIHSLVGSVQPNVAHKTPDFPTSGNVSANSECVALQNNSVSNNSQQEKSPMSIIVDLVESDNECDDSFSIIPKIVMTSSQNPNDYDSYSEDSEVELIDVIVPPDSPVSTECPDNTVGQKNAVCTKNSSSELNIKTEKVNETTHTIPKSQDTKSNPELQTPLIRTKYEVAYSTGICQKLTEENESKDNVRKQLNLNNDKLHNEKSKSDDKIVKQLNLYNELQGTTVSTAKESLILSKVKKEPCDDLEIILVTASSSMKIKEEAIKESTAISNISADPIVTRKNSVVNNAKDSLIINKKVKKEPSDGDDCEIILDTTSTSNSSTNLSNVQIHSNKNIKVERDSEAVKQAPDIHISNRGPIATRKNSMLTEKKQKMHEIQSSPRSCSRMIQPSENETVNELHTLNIKALLENLKKEFATYQEILVTEQSVETTFKILEKCQAERLKSLKTTIMECLESAPSNTDNNSLKIAVSKLLDSSELSSPTSLKDCTKVSSTCPSESSSASDISMQDLKTLATMNLVPLSSISEEDIKPNLAELQCTVKQEPSTSCKINSMSFGQKCVLCAKDAISACQQCAKAFYCSSECGMKYWRDGHYKTCTK